MKLTDEEIKHIALLARLGISEDEVAKFRGQISNILENFEILQEVDTSDVQPTSQVTGLRNIVKKDEAIPSLSQREIMANAPQEEDGFFKIRAVLE